MDATKLAQLEKSLESQNQNPENGRNKASTAREKLVSGTRTLGQDPGSTRTWVPFWIRGPGSHFGYVEDWGWGGGGVLIQSWGGLLTRSWGYVHTS